jgi:aspartate oxidase
VFLKYFFQQFGKINALETEGIAVTGEIAEVKNQVNKSGELAHEKVVVVHFNSSAGKSHFIEYIQQMIAGEFISVGSGIDVIYLPSDPTIFKIPSKNISSKNKWLHLVIGIVVLLAGGYLSYLYYTNPSIFGLLPAQGV